MDFFWDASALVKRYLVEKGSDTVNRLFAQTSRSTHVTTAWGYTETYAILLRRHNADFFNRAALTTALSSLQSEVVSGPAFTFLTLDDALIFASTTLIQRHNLNSADAALLNLMLDYSRKCGRGAPALVLVSADRRFLRAAAAEGVPVLNPEELDAGDVPTFLANL